MAQITTSSTLFEPELVKDIFSKVKGHSSLAALCGSAAIPFAGTEYFVFSMDGEASIVGEGAKKPAGEADWGKVTIKPIKFIYQHRLTDEFIHMSEEKQLPYLAQFTDGFAKKIARALDIAAFHGVNPATNTASNLIGNNCFDQKVSNTITITTLPPDDDIDSAATLIQTADGDISGIAMSNTFAASLGRMKTADSHLPVYPEFRFGAKPKSFSGLSCDVNNTLSFGSSKDRALIGDFANAFKWGFAENVPLEIIPYGNPDGKGDLKESNEIVLRSEAYIGWGILVPESFAFIKEGT